jgi:hypothetical protein
MFFGSCPPITTSTPPGYLCVVFWPIPGVWTNGVAGHYLELCGGVFGDR